MFCYFDFPKGKLGLTLTNYLTHPWSCMWYLSCFRTQSTSFLDVKWRCMFPHSKLYFFFSSIQIIILLLRFYCHFHSGSKTLKGCRGDLVREATSLSCLGLHLNWVCLWIFCSLWFWVDSLIHVGYYTEVFSLTLTKLRTKLSSNSSNTLLVASGLCNF